MIQLFPEGFEEVDDGEDVELAAYTDAGGEERVWHAFGGVHAADVEAGWEERWRSFHKPVTVGSLWVGPPWETPPAVLFGVVRCSTSAAAPACSRSPARSSGSRR